VRKGAWKKGYLFKLLRKNKRTKKLGKWLDNQTEKAINRLFHRAEREDTRRRRSGSIPLRPKGFDPRVASPEYAFNSPSPSFFSLASHSFFRSARHLLVSPGLSSLTLIHADLRNRAAL
jgi:hypothetical protein